MSMNLDHDPAANLDYMWDWSPWLRAGETITAHIISILPPDEMEAADITATSNSVTAWISGGVLGRTYAVTCHITTNMGREDDRTFNLSVRDR